MSGRPFRYTLILATAAVGTVLAAFGGWRFARASAPLNGPIVLISIDTLRADHLPAYGYMRVKTPAIDGLAADGVVFERAYAHVPETRAAHTALLTGRLPFETGVRSDTDGPLKPGERVLADMLRDRGYATGAVVSSSALGRSSGLARGFQYFDDDIPATAVDVPVGAFERDGAVSEKLAEKWLSSIGTSRAFLFLQLNEPHRPYTPPEAYSQYAPYDGEIAYADEIVGRLVQFLKARQLYERATIILISDHGEGLGDHGEQEHGLFVYDEDIHVPFIVKLEGNERAGQRVADVVQHIDLVPTVLDLVKASIPGNLRGRSLRRLLENGSGSAPDRPVYAEAMYGQRRFGWSGLASIVSATNQYIRAPHEELYDLARDAGERDNLTSRAPAVRDGLKATLEEMSPAPKAESGASADPKDKREVLETYRDALAAVADRRWPQAITLLGRVLKTDPMAADVWLQLGDVAGLIGRADVALDAYRHASDLRPSADGHLGAAEVLFRDRKYEEAADEARAALDAAGERDHRSAAAAHAMLARLALARHDADTAREQAQLAEALNPRQPVEAFVSARLLYDEAKYEEALDEFERASAAAQKPGAAPLEGLHYFAGDALLRLDRRSEAEWEFTEELRAFPHDIRAAVALASMYQADARTDEAEDVVTAMLRTTPTPESYAAAARLWKTLGRPRRAEAARTEARRALGH